MHVRPLILCSRKIVTLNQNGLHAVRHVAEHTDQDGGPSMREADLLIRSLLHDPDLGYVPPFIVLYQQDRHGECPHGVDTPYSYLNCWSR